MRIAFLTAALNGFDALACDIRNACLKTPCHEKIWFEAGIECSNKMKDRVIKIVQGTI